MTLEGDDYLKKKTYNNVLKAIKMIIAKGYTKEEAETMALKIFDEHENEQMPIEFYINKIINKTEWKESYNV